MKCDFPAPKLPWRCSASDDPDDTAPAILPSAWSKARASWGVTS